MNHVTANNIMNIEDKINQGISFMCGDMLATVLFMYTSLGSLDWLHPIAKVTLAFIVGIVGGVGGLLGKDLYGKIKDRFNLFK